ncbi:UV radiation resistance-associated gene protein [Termitomyces sp. T112]|nr:UV radiation resistance-associated gene protein [Termitomyces sp. T112]
MSRQKSPAQATHETALTDRRIRHITAIQVHNLTPFPARDSLASALSQPAEQSQFTSHGHLSDDLDVTMQRKRSRRTSTNSHRSVPSEDGSRNEGSIVGSTSTERGSKTSGSRIHCLEGTDHRQYPTSGSTPTTRPHRARTTSMASSIRSHISGPSNSLYGGSTSTLTPPINSMSSDNSQAELENVIQSRLVETFITITIPESLHLNELPSSVISPPLLSSASRDKIVPLNAEGHLPRKLVKVTATSPSGRATPKIRRESATLPRISSRPPKSASISVTEVNGDAKRVALQSTTESVQSLPFKHVIPVPHYFSPIHRPSTNPRFTIDTTSNRTLLEGADCNGSRLKIEVWGNVGPGWYHKLSRKGKEKEVDLEREWKILQERDFDLRELVPIPDSSSVYNSQLPLNSLVITLSPPGGIFYLPPPISFPRRSFSPADGCASDPEPERKSANFPSMFETSKGHRECPVPISRRGHRAGDAASPLTSQNDTPATTVGWQDLFKLVTLQSCILDNESSLLEVVRGIDKVLGSDSTLDRRREVSQYEARLDELAANHEKVIQDSNNLRSQIRARMKNLHQRKQMLNLAKEQLEQDIESEFDLKNEVLLHQAQQTYLRARFGPTRTTLISILSSIYPIELLSPPDLLYAILDVPLPIPLSCSDPAPPLTLPSRKDVNEDAVATALGYAAQVVQLLSMYLGKSLVYPVTCIGSRSLIRDNISAMVGPRMFPLYSKGVDTYRFEYGVFLLNKDIELLMTDRDLRALDMRHTLPNLKNLLLTLTDGEGALLRQSRPPDSPMSLVSELELASRPESPVDPNSTTPKASHTAALEGSSPLASRSSTPTIAPDSSKKPRSFIAFSPLTDFLRGRHPSSSRISMKSQPDTEEPQSEESSATTSVSENSSDDEDRKTISGVSRGADQGWKVDSPSVITRVEKLSEDSHSPAHSTPPLIVTHIVR